MNKLVIIGNLSTDVELRSTTSGKTVCNFNVAVNRRYKQDGQPDADFFRVSAWDGLAENCAKYLAKGRKVAVIGSVSVRTWESNGHHGATLEVNAQDIEFLSPRQDTDHQSGMTKVSTDDNPFEDRPY